MPDPKKPSERLLFRIIEAKYRNCRKLHLAVFDVYMQAVREINDAAKPPKIQTS